MIEYNYYLWDGKKIYHKNGTIIFLLLDNNVQLNIIDILRRETFVKTI